MSSTRAPRPLAVLFFLVLLAAGLLATPQGPARAEGPFTITEAPPLTWGFKLSWRNYAPLAETAAGAEPAGPGSNNIRWGFETGSYDPTTQATELRYRGLVRWQKYPASLFGGGKPPGYTGPETDPYLLDVTLRDPRIVIGRDSSTLTAVASSRDRETWEMVEYGRVPIVNLDVLGISPTLADGTTTWSGIVATVSDQGVDAFDGNYRAGQVVDPVAFSYTGPGGAPDFSEHWDTPGAPTLKLLQNEIFASAETGFSVEPLWIDRANQIVHASYPVVVGGVNSRRLQAFSLREMRPLGEPLVLPNAQFPQQLRVNAYDSNQNRLLYRQTAAEVGITKWLRFDPVAKQYETGSTTDPQLKDPAFVGAGSRTRLGWDPTRNRGFRVERFVPAGVGEEDFDAQEWRLVTYREGAGQTWEKKSFPLPSFPAGQNQEGYAVETLISAPTYATASDGSLIVLATLRSSTDPAHPAPATIPGAYRLTFDDTDTAVSVEPLPVEIGNAGEANAAFNAVQTSANGHLLLISQAGPVVHCRIVAAAPVQCDDPVSTKQVETTANVESRFAIDPADGTVWFGGTVSRRLAALAGGELLGSQLFEQRNPRGGPVLAGDGHIVYAQTNDGSPDATGGSKTWGYGKFERLGFVPTVTAQPQPATATLAAGEQAESVTFGSTAKGDPAPARQWQVRAPGSPLFADLAGETGSTLQVEATRAGNGAEYRAVYENAAGRVASEPASLTVHYAPRLLYDAADVTAVEGEGAEFSVLIDGSPEPTVSWQRRVGGFWQAIAADDDNFTVAGPVLTVLDTNVEQSGALFRAKLTNSVGATFSRPAKLTVETDSALAPGEYDGIGLEWSGSAELQKAPPFGGSNYFSAGASDGDEASYRSVAGNAAVFHASASGGEALASWATRASQVVGGSTQLVRLYGGVADVAADGSATIAWDGAFSVNFYGGLVPFTVTDPELTVDADGDGRLSADLSGYASSQANPNQRSPLAAVPGVTIATFSGLELDPAAAATAVPDYAGVEATVPAGFAPQDRVSAGWGAWPQPFVDFQVKTGLAPYWYSSGGSADPLKQPAPFVVDFGAGPPPPGPEELLDPPHRPAAPAATPGAPASIFAVKRPQKVGPRRTAKLATLSCLATTPCEVLAPRRVAVRIAGRSYRATLVAPSSLAAGATAVVRARLSPAALAALGVARATLRARVVVRTDAVATIRTLRVEVVGTGWPTAGGSRDGAARTRTWNRRFWRPGSGDFHAQSRAERATFLSSGECQRE